LLHLKTYTFMFKYNRQPLLAFLLIGSLALAACDSGMQQGEPASMLSMETMALATSISDDLELQTTERNEVQTFFARRTNQQHTPGFLWTTAAELRQTLDAAQVAALIEMADSIRAEGALLGEGAFFGRPTVRGMGPAMGRRPGSGERPGPAGMGPMKPRFSGNERHLGGILDSLLTDSQKEAAEAIRLNYQDQLKALHEQFKAGEIDRVVFVTSMQSIMDAMKAEVMALLTDEQKAAIEAAIAEHEASMAEKLAEKQERMQANALAVMSAMFDALDADDAQRSVLTTIYEAQRVAMQALHEAARSGQLVDDALMAALTELKEAERTAVAGVLSVDQLITFDLHNALTIRAVRVAAGLDPRVKG
jgi:hypothetical protein